MSFDAGTQDRVYAHCSNTIAAAGKDREALFLARLALLLFEQVKDEQICMSAIDNAFRDLPIPSLSAD